MKIFELEKPILEKIEKVVDAYFAAHVPPITPDILYLDFEPDEGYIHDIDHDGAVCVYVRSLGFDPGRGSETAKQESDSLLSVDLYGFGDPIPKNGEPEILQPTIREAQNRAEALTTLAYRAIMDRVEKEGLPNANPAQIKSYGTGIDILNKYPQSITKFSPQGTMGSRRGAVIYRSVYEFTIEEDVPAEALGPDFAGPGTWATPTYNPGDEPE